MRVAFTLMGIRQWTGGYNYLLNLLSVLDEFGSGVVEPVLFVGRDDPAVNVEPFKRLATVVPDRAFDRRRQPVYALSALIMGRDSLIEHAFRTQRIDLVFEFACFLGWRLSTPALAWITDFQHRVLPEMFSKPAYWRREAGIQAQVRTRETIMLSSGDAQSNCERYYPITKGRTHVVRFAVQPQKSALATEPEKVRERYGLPQNFIYLPNQFWKHKNHRLVVDALSLLRNSETVVAATGQPTDHRHRGLFEQLRALVSHRGMENRFRFLGLVDYNDVIGLMRASSALLNPSLFEGWSTTVEEGRSLGVPMMLSDLPVHREQMGDDALYFSADSPEQLAEVLRNFVALPPERRREREATAMADTSRLAGFATEFESVVHCAARST